ncbi:ferrous iron transport protein B [Anaerotardibacter muris]|uniref:ferrous iron transport protein B n=1 Tax=Anaerotardibacter muris TaxID=2941505 RepID=UPI00203B7C7B|nr:ferrous iron transport protein B [Anaerotardibacter muris]
MRVALVGNPNCGKTTLFNALTGANQYVGNWPGVTVEKKSGKLKADKDVEVIDLPGIYSLSPYTLEEVIARDFLVKEDPDAILNIIDGTNLERNLYLTTQLLEMGIPVVVAVNMMDVVRKRGDQINITALEEKLSAPVVEISALKNEGIDQIVNCLKSIPQTVGIEAMPYSREVEDAITEIIERLQGSLEYAYTDLKELKEGEVNNVPEHLLRFYAIKLLEKDEKIRESLKNPPKVEDIVERIEKKYDDDTESVITNERYTWISSIMPEVRSLNDVNALTTSDKIDRVVTNRFLALPIFAVVMFLVYYISVSTVGTFATDWANDGVFGDGWFLGSGGDEYAEVVEEFDEASENIAAFDEAAIEEGLDPESDNFLVEAEEAGIIGTYEAFDDETGENELVEVDAATYEESLDIVAPYAGDADAIAAFEMKAEEEGLDPESETFIEDAEEAGIMAEYTKVDEETGEDVTQIVDAAAYEAELEGGAPDPAEYGIWVPGIPVIVEEGLAAIDAADWLTALILDGIIAGVGAVLGFIPQMLVLFLLLAFLESCGYMSRIAFILDRVFRRFGLSGKSFVPILIGTGCGVPGVMASRTIENQNDRRMTVMTTTFIPCGAKLPIIALFAAAVFGGVWWVAPSAYFLGIAAILCTGIILKKTRFFAGDPAPFIMELPAYHMPTVGAVLRSMWERAWSFIKKAGTIILLACILVWFISSYGVVDGVFMAVEDQNDSILAVLGTLICWIFNPLGWGDWQAASAAVTGLIAKENVVGTLGILYNGDAGWYANVQASFTPVVAYSFLAFNLLCAPCFAAMGAIKREMNNRKWFWAAIGYQCGLAWVVALWIFQFAGLATGEATFGVFTIIAAVLAIAFIYLLFRKNKYKGKEGISSVSAES